MIKVYNRQKDLKLQKGSVRALIESTLSYLKISFDELTIYFVNTSQICKIHAQFFKDPTPTDCISFPIDSSYLGEIFVCPATAIQYAEKKGLNPYNETALYIVHGLLHLIGYDDLEEKTRRRMRKKEISCMSHLNKLNILLK